MKKFVNIHVWFSLNCLTELATEFHQLSITELIWAKRFCHHMCWHTRKFIFQPLQRGPLLKFSLFFFAGIESRYELQLYAIFINQNTQRTTSIQLLLVMSDKAGHRNLSFSKIPQIFWEYEFQNLAKEQKRLSYVYLLLCSPRVLCLKNPLGEIQGQELLWGLGNLLLFSFFLLRPMWPVPAC